MAWEYLQTNILDERFEIVAELVDVYGKDILDLDAGTARLINFIPDTFNKYYANDIRPEYYNKNPRIDYQIMDDTEMFEYMKDKSIDILCVFGHGAGHRFNNGYESTTLDDVFKEFTYSHEPETLIIEGSTYHNEQFKMLDELVDSCLDRYVQDEKVETDKNPLSEYAHRTIYVLSRKGRVHSNNW